MTPQELKNSILQRAIEGRLVEQRKEEGTGTELFDKIQKEKKELIREGKIKKQKSLEEIKKDEIPFDIPETWKWVRLGNIFHFINGDRGKNYPAKSKLKEQGDIPFISAINLKNGTIDESNLLYLDLQQYEKLGSGKLLKDDIVLCIRGSLGKTCIYPFEKGAIASSLVILRNYKTINLKFVLNYLNSYLFYSETRKYDNGSVQPNLSAENAKKILLPLPPLAEQKRIVEKIEELMPLVDEYEENWQKLEEFNQRFPEDMKKSLLQEAIKGKLVEQRKEEGTGTELFDKIQKEKKELIKEGKIKKQKPLPEITEDEIPFDIPETWKWVRLGEITEMNPKNQLEDDLEVGFVPMALVEDGYKNKHSYELKKWKTIKKGYTHFADGDIGIAKITPCFQNRKSVILSNLPNGYGAGTTELSIVRPYSKYLYPEYLLSIFKTYYFINGGIKSFSGTAGQQRIDKNYLLLLLLPLPPLAEQKRIVDRLEELLPLCDKLIKNKEK